MDFITGYVLGSRMLGKKIGMTASAASFSTGSASGDLHDVHERIDRVLMVIEAMWSLLEESGYTREQLVARIEELDAADGRADGRSTPPAQPCPQCGAAINAGAAICQFCGYGNPDIHPVQGI
ncbi:MAG: hypothetical protein OEP52_05965 [Acidimicrobiia bacterium]|nr:hypothetical protein [Acidimicrobiia bacterium]